MTVIITIVTIGLSLSTSENQLLTTFFECEAWKRVFFSCLKWCRKFQKMRDSWVLPYFFIEPNLRPSSYFVNAPVRGKLGSPYVVFNSKNLHSTDPSPCFSFKFVSAESPRITQTQSKLLRVPRLIMHRFPVRFHTVISYTLTNTKQ